MIIDMHCHYDMIPNPENYLRHHEAAGDIIIGMTNTPSHFEIGISHARRYDNIRLSLGFHPQLAEENQSELIKFSSLLSKTSYVGEIGLDFNRFYISSRDVQLSSFDYICGCLSGHKKIISIHSRMAEREVLEILSRYNIATPIFHWYTGPLNLISPIIELGAYFSINEAMTLSEKGRKIISKIPLNRLLTESDAPYNRKSNIISALNNLHIDNSVIYNNFKDLINTIR